MSNHYKASIDIISNGIGPAQSLSMLMHIAKEHPSLFVQSYYKTVNRSNNKPVWYDEVMGMDSKINAIKLLRNKTGWTLKESKDWVDGEWGG